MASLTVLSQSETELSLQQHLDIAPDLFSYSRIDTEVDPEPLMMAQSVPHQSTDKKRVKVYELRNNDWFDRGTGFCTAAFIPVRHTLSLPIASDRELSRRGGSCDIASACHIPDHDTVLTLSYA